MLMTQQHHISATLAPSRRLLVGRPLDSRRAAMALAEGDVVGQGFANLYVMTTRPGRDTVRRVNVMKGRPPDQVGSITTTPSRIPDVYDWSALPDGVTRRSILGVIDTFYGIGPFGFRGPAAPHVASHLTLSVEGVTTAQVIAPGYACPSNEFLARALEEVDSDLLHTTSANRSRHATGADDSPAHWRSAGLHDEFGHECDFLMLEHDDEDAARMRYPRHLPMPTTILSFQKVGSEGRRPSLVLERHGSMHVDDVRTTLDGLGFGLTIGPRATARLQLRQYA